MSTAIFVVYALHKGLNWGGNYIKFSEMELTPPSHWVFHLKAEKKILSLGRKHKALQQQRS